MLYLLRCCVRKNSESRYREIYAAKITQFASMYPGQFIIFSNWDLVQDQLRLGLAPVQEAINDPKEECVFYCIILTVFWICLSVAIFLFLVAGFKVASTFN